MKRFSVFAIALMVVVLCSTAAHAFWLVYHKPAFHGRVLDAETKEPIEGAVVVVVYTKTLMFQGPAGGSSQPESVRETLTDKDGNFSFLSHTTVLNPLFFENRAEFLIYKPGYGNLNQRVSPPFEGIFDLIDKEEFFSREEVGTQGVMEDKGMGKKYNVTFGVVELPKIKTREERLRAFPSAPGTLGSKDLPLLYKIMNEENRRLGLGEEK